VYLDKWQSRQDLGLAEQDPLLRVHMRTPDRPGATLEVLESLRETLSEMAPESLGERDWKVWYARVVVAHGNLAQIQLTVRLALDPAMTPPAGKPVTQWGLAEFSKTKSRDRPWRSRLVSWWRPGALPVRLTPAWMRPRTR
jgi:hypothetical protein